VAAYLAPLWRHLEGLSGVSCLPNTEAISVSRGSLLKGAMQGRAGAPFTVLVATKPPLSEGGAETAVESVLSGFDALVDATGTYGQRVWLGPGGMPALGERSLEAQGEASGVVCGVPDVAGKDRARFDGGKVTCVIGSGYSAITTVKLLTDLATAEASGGTPAAVRVVWATRRHGSNGSSSDGSSGGELYGRVANDSLPERDALACLANAIARGDIPSGDIARKIGGTVTHIGGAQLTSVRDS
jgi:hypothetical protein